MRLVFPVLAVVALVGCGGESDPTPPTCALGEVAVVGTVDGQSVSQRFHPDSSAFGNALNNEEGEYVAGTSNGGSPITLVKVGFKSLLINGKSVDAHGSVDLSSLQGPQVGNCETGALVSTISMDADGNGGTFVLRDLHDSPYCSGASHAGSLAGCFKFSN